MDRPASEVRQDCAFRWEMRTQASGDGRLVGVGGGHE